MAATRFLDHILSGTAAARPAASATPQGALYFATDTGVISRSDGTSTWTTLVTAGGIPVTILDAKGDLIVASAADTAAKLTAGTNGYVLTANSAATNGVEWAAASGGGTTQLDYVTQTSDLTVTATTAGAAQAFLTGNSVSYTAVVHKLEWWSANISGTGVAIAELYDGASDLGVRVGQSAGGSAGVPGYGAYFFTPSAGSHQYSIKFWRGTANMTVSGNGGGAFTPAWLRVTIA